MLFRKRTPPKRFRIRRKRHEITCSRCGKKCSVKFHPKGTSPILCSSCYGKKKKQEKIMKRRAGRAAVSKSASSVAS